MSASRRQFLAAVGAAAATALVKRDVVPVLARRVAREPRLPFDLALVYQIVYFGVMQSEQHNGWLNGWLETTHVRYDLIDGTKWEYTNGRWRELPVFYPHYAALIPCFDKDFVRYDPAGSVFVATRQT